MRIAAIYLASRVVTTAFFLLAAGLSPAGSRFGPGADLATYAVAWDAQHYQRIAAEGYPIDLPLTDAGDVAQNAWAFMPFYPWAAQATGWLLGSWTAGAVALALVTGYLCCLVLRSILKPAIGETASLWAVAFFACAPLAAMFQVAYAEAPFLLLIMLGIRCLQRRRYGWLYVILPAMAFTRPGVLAFALCLGLFGIRRWLTRAQEPLARGEAVHIVALGALATTLGLSWPVIAGVVTGRPDAYLATELSWRRLWVGDDGGFVPFEGWLQATDYWFRSWGLDPAWGLVGLVAPRGRRRCGHRVQPAGGASRTRDPPVGGQLPHLSAGRVPPAVERVPTPLPAVAAVGCRRASPQPCVAARRAGGLPRGSVVVDLEHVRAGNGVLAHPLTRQAARRHPTAEARKFADPALTPVQAA